MTQQSNSNSNKATQIRIPLPPIPPSSISVLPTKQSIFGSNRPKRKKTQPTQEKCSSPPYQNLARPESRRSQRGSRPIASRIGLVTESKFIYDQDDWAKKIGFNTNHDRFS